MKNMKLTEFIDLTASDAPAPGGGSVAAVSGALAAALSEMVANLTVGKEKYADYENEMREIIKKCSGLRGRLLDDIQRDSNSFNDVIAAMKLPRDTEEQKTARTKAMQEGLKIAATIPFEIAMDAFEILPLAEKVVEHGNKNAVTDGLVSAMLARTAVLSALYNTKINLASIKDEAYVKDFTAKVKDLEAKTVEYEKTILSKSSL